MTDFKPTTPRHMTLTPAEIRDRLASMRAMFQHWADWNRDLRAEEGLATADHTHVYAVPPHWPTHATLRAWAALMAEAADALAPLAATCQESLQVQPAPAAMPGVDLEGALNHAARRMQRIGTAGSEEDIEDQLRPYFQPLAQENERLKDALWQARWDLVTNNGYDNNDPTIVQINAVLPPENK